MWGMALRLPPVCKVNFMQIKKIEAFPLRYPEPNDHNNLRHIMLVRVETDDGLVGWGEAITMWPEASRATKIIVETACARCCWGATRATPMRSGWR